jgi:eukaryotic-like serine/threonine-protein kinase
MNGPLTETSPPVGGRYKVEKWINAGGMQHVYLANDKLFDRKVALKTPKDDTGNKRFENSAEVSAKVNHANVAKTLDYLLDDSGRAFLVEELVLGSDLEEILNQYLPVLPPSTCARILHQLAKGLATSHAAKVVHRDLKPSNIMIVGGWKFDEVKITDFGIAKLAEEEIGAWAETQGSTQSKTVLGAIPYMSPESILDFKAGTYPSDIWSIGAIVYRLLSGNPPFGSGLKSIPSILNAAAPSVPAQVQPAQFFELGKEICVILNRCMDKDPTNRPTASELVLLCDALCYSIDSYEIATIQRRGNGGPIGFASSGQGKDLMCHRDNFYGGGAISIGKRIWTGRHAGVGSDRAFPIVALR